jgi:hypothetical protein
MDLFTELINKFSINELEKAREILNNKIKIDKIDYIKDLFINQIDSNDNMIDSVKESFLELVDTIDIQKENANHKLKLWFNKSLIVIIYNSSSREFSYKTDKIYNGKIPIEIYNNEIDKLVISIINWYDR